MNKKNLSAPPMWMAWSIWGLGAFFYLIGFYQRVAPAVITDELMADFAIGAAALGNLSAFYFYSYVLMQIPTGLLADSWGPRRLLTAGAATAALGTFIFAVAPGLFWANLGRLLIGGSVAVAFVVLLKLANHWLPGRIFAQVSGLSLFFGIVGAVSAGVPLRLLVNSFGWRPVMLFSAFTTLVLALGIWVLVRDDPSDRGYASFAPKPEGAGEGGKKISILAGMGRIWRKRNIWLLFWAPGGIVGPILTFSGLWGVPFLKAKYSLPTAQAAAVCSTIMVAWALGGPAMGWLSDRTGRRKPVYLAANVVVFLGWLNLIYWPGLSLTSFTIIGALVGFASGAMVLGFAFGKESVSPSLAGTAAGTINMGVMIGPTILQPVVGLILDACWTGQMVGKIRVYDLESYQKAFMVMPAWAGLACLLIGLTRETYARQSA